MAEKRIYDDPRWKQVRKAVLDRDGHRCRIVGAKCRGKATHVDHIRSLADGGAPFDPDNLRASCASCNIGRRNTELAERARGVRAGDAVSSLRQTRPKYHHEMTLAEFLADTGYDWPEPPGGWADG